jgi:hypothetical protein
VTCDPQGWTSVDLTAQLGIFFHVDDFIGLGGGDFGRLTPIAGNQSMWCGTRLDSTSENFYSCEFLPGYGNYWDQRFESVPFPVSGDVSLTYHIRWDSEPGYDYTYVEYQDTGGTWVQLAAYAGIGETTDNWIIPDSTVSDSLKIRFRFDSDASYSDEDGDWNTDGAVIFDGLTVSDTTGLIDSQDFEAEAVGGRSCEWIPCR